MRRWWIFVVLTYLLSWVFWVPVALWGHDVTSSVWGVPYILGGFGPSIAGIVMVYRTYNLADRRDFWHRVISFRRISVSWYLFIVLVFPVILALSLAVSRLLTGVAPAFPVLAQIAAQPVALIGMLIIGIVAGPLSEELGWRGYGLDQLQAHWGPLRASLILAPVWWAWHLPLFFIAGTTQQAWGIATLAFWLFLLNIFPLSVLMTWVYNQNRRSILAAVLLHFTYNFVLALVSPLDATAMAFQAGLLALVAIGVVLLCSGVGCRPDTPRT